MYKTSEFAYANDLGIVAAGLGVVIEGLPEDAANTEVLNQLKKLCARLFTQVALSDYLDGEANV